MSLFLKEKICLGSSSADVEESLLSEDPKLGKSSSLILKDWLSTNNLDLLVEVDFSRSERSESCFLLPRIEVVVLFVLNEVCKESLFCFLDSVEVVELVIG